MDMNKRLFALAVMPVLSLFALEAMAGKEDPAANYAPSEFGTPRSGVIRKCPEGGTLFKNVDPFISGGNPAPDDFPVERSETFLVDGKEIVLTVTWDSDNSFFYDFGVEDADGNLTKAGQMHEIGVENNSDKIIYEYASPVQGDSGLNKLLAGGTADKANHIDICISPLDTIDPVVVIRLEPSSDGTTLLGEVNGTTVSGKIDIIAEVTDETDVNVTITIESSDGTDVTPVFLAQTKTTSDCDPAAPDCIAYTWGPWDTSLVPPGDYIIKVVATETKGLLLDTIEPLTVTVSVQNCLEGADGVPDNEIGVGGCNPSGFQVVELPNELDGLLDDKTITQYAVPAKLSAQTETCGIKDSVTDERYEFVAQDPRVNADGSLIYNADYPAPLDLSTVFDLSGIDLSLYAPNGVFMRADTVGSPCLVLILGDANFSFADFYHPNTGAPLLGTGAYNYAVTQFPENVPGMTTLPEIGDLQPDPQLAGFQPDLQFVPQATYQRDDVLILVEQLASPFTSDVINPQRKLTATFSWFMLNTREVCLSLDPDLPYFEAVLQCKIDLAIEYFGNLEQALIEAEPNLIFPSLNNLLTDLNKARSMVKVRFWGKANEDLTALYDQVVGAQWVVDERNDPGMVIMRIKNLFFRIEQLELAENALP
jgi:hypothetical protein